MKAATAGAADLYTLVRKGLAASNVGNEARRPFRFLLCGDPGLVAELRALLLWGRDVSVPLDAPATLETIDPLRIKTVVTADAKAVIVLGRPGDLAGAGVDLLRQLRLPIFALTVDPASARLAPEGAPLLPTPTAAPLAGEMAEYVVPAIEREALRARFFPHLLERCRGIEVAVGRRLPAVRETVASKLTRDAAMNALKISATSALADNIPLLGIVLGAVASAGDMVAITGVQVVLMMQIGAVYGKDPDAKRVWEMLPVVGGGLGWRALSRQLSGFIPVAGVAVKGAVAYAGTIAVGESVAFFYEQGRHMTSAQAEKIYDERRRAAMQFAREMIARLRSKR